MVQLALDRNGNIVPSDISVINADTGFLMKNIPSVPLANDMGMSRMINAFNKPIGNFSALAQRPNRFSSLGQQMNAQGLMPQQQRTMTPGFSSLGQQMNAQGLMGAANIQRTPSTTSKASSIGKGLLGFAQSPYGEGFATGLLKAGGYSPRPISFAEALGTAMEQGQKSRADAQKFAFEKEQFDFTKTQKNIENLLAEAQIGVELQKLLKPKLSDMALRLMNFGIDPNSPEGRQYLLDELNSNKMEINFKENDQEFQSSFFNKTLIPTTNKLSQASIDNNEIRNVYGQMKVLLDQGVETGVFDAFFLDFKRLLRDAGVLTKSEVDSVNLQEMFRKLSSFTVPRMRVQGSGATSDFEAKLFTDATATLGDDELTNKRIVASRLAYLNFEQAYADFYSDRAAQFDPKSDRKDFSNESIGNAFRDYLDSNNDILASIVGVDTNNLINSEDDFRQRINDGTLKSGDLVFSNIKGDDTYNTFVVLDDDDIANYREN